MKIYKYLFALIAGFLFTIGISFAQEKAANMTLKFEKEDSINVCKVIVKSEDLPVSEVSVKLYVQRLFSLLPIGKSVSTDENGIASFNFPNDIPGDENGKLTIIAKIEDDENYGTLEAKGNANWGLPKTKVNELERSLSGSRARAPIYFIIVSNLIIIGIWGTLIYVIFQLFKIRKISKHLIKK
jgi:hypothetical protein